MTTSCPHCGGPWIQTEKDTFGGEDVREFQCTACGRSGIEQRGPALWQSFSEARERSKALDALTEWFDTQFPGKMTADFDALLTAGDTLLVAALAEIAVREQRPLLSAAITLLEQAGGDEASQSMMRIAQAQARLIVSSLIESGRLERAKTVLFALDQGFYLRALNAAVREAALARAAQGDLAEFAQELLRVSAELNDSFSDPILRRQFVAVFTELALEHGGTFVPASHSLQVGSRL